MQGSSADTAEPALLRRVKSRSMPGPERPVCWLFVSNPSATKTQRAGAQGQSAARRPDRGSVAADDPQLRPVLLRLQDRRPPLPAGHLPLLRPRDTGEDVRQPGHAGPLPPASGTTDDGEQRSGKCLASGRTRPGRWSRRLFARPCRCRRFGSGRSRRQAQAARLLVMNGARLAPA
jgi:hypothetical protein